MRRWLQLASGVAVTLLAVTLLLTPRGRVSSSLEGVRSIANAWLRPAIPWSDLAVGADPERISPPTVVEFFDYECASCYQAHLTLARLLRDPSVVRYLHFPLAVHASAAGAAKASICAERQGRFQSMHAQLFERDDWRYSSDWLDLAAQAGVPDLRAFLACIDSRATEDRLNADIALGQRLGVRGIPTFVTPHTMFIGVPSEEVLSALIDYATEPERSSAQVPSG